MVNKFGLLTFRPPFSVKGWKMLQVQPKPITTFPNFLAIVAIFSIINTAPLFYLEKVAQIVISSVYWPFLLFWFAEGQMTSYAFSWTDTLISILPSKKSIYLSIHLSTGSPKKDDRFLKIQNITNLLSDDNEGKIMKNIEF